MAANRIIKNEVVRGNIPNTGIRARRDSSAPQKLGTVSGFHYHEELEFLPVRSGEFHCVVDGKDYVCHEGDLIFINSGVTHTTFCHVPDTYVGLLQFRMRDFYGSEAAAALYSMRYRNLLSAPIRIFRDPALFEAVEGALAENEIREKGYDCYVRSYIYRIIGALVREGILADESELLARKDLQKMLPVLSYIHDNYAENITLDAISEQLGYDTSYFCRLFKSTMNSTFVEYLNFVRVSKAERLLAESEKTILEVSQEVGFSSVSYFYRMFKRYRSCSPHFYRAVRNAYMK